MIRAAAKLVRAKLGTVSFFIPGDQLSKAIELEVRQFDNPSSCLELGVDCNLLLFLSSWAYMWDKAIALGDFLFADVPYIQAQVAFRCCRR